MPKMTRRLQVDLSNEPSMNLTPLIDVVFVILIMFIVIAPLLEVDSIALASGAQSTANKRSSLQKEGHITIAVDASNRITLNKRPISLLQLKEILARAKKALPTATPQVFHDKRALFGTYQAIKNVIEEAGYEQMDIILMPSS